MRNKLLFLTVVLLATLGLTCVLAGQAAAQGETSPYGCQNPRGAYYLPDVFPRYEARNNRLLLVDWLSGETVRVLDTSLVIDDGGGSSFDWSPDCRYLSARVNRSGSYQGWTVAFWDVTTGNRLGMFPGILNGQHEWDPRSEYVVLYTGREVSLWHIPTAHVVALDVPFHRSYGAFFDHLAWDYHRGLLLGVSRGGPEVVRVYDLATGAAVAQLNSGGAADVDFVRSPDGGQVVVFETVNAVQWRGADPANAYVTLWRLDDLSSRPLHTGLLAESTRQIAISPDGRYLVAGMVTLRVWDLRGDTRAPVYHYHGPFSRESYGSIGALWFMDNTTIATMSLYGRYTTQWDLHTGVEMPVQ